MSIVAERPVIAQATRPTLGARELAEEMEREDTAQGPEAEPEGSVRRLSRSYTGPVRVDLRTAEDRPLTSEQAERVQLLAVEHGEHLVRYVAARLGGAAYWAEAQDVAQDVWVAVTRGRLPQLLTADDEYVWPRLAAAAKFQVLEAARTDRRREWAPRDVEAWERTTSGTDETECAVLALLESADGGPWAPADYADAIAALSPRQREVLELRCCEGMSTVAIGARLGISTSSASLHLRAAVERLGGTPAKRQDRPSLPDGWERVLDRLASGLQRDVLRLAAAGASMRAIGRQLGVSDTTVRRTYQRAIDCVRQMLADRSADTTAAGRSRPCATGCVLRAARAGVPA
ncbi:sigma factor-like helix-turn-helix DNA-binding protein [Streptomyces sp. NPDC059218]|uniref:sigma factor-like helix-turn-helix DNA-binding protein n=1 Tax=unclassified Streptomyces TaxID=2593676 RepID=UPI0036956CFF